MQVRIILPLVFTAWLNVLSAQATFNRAQFYEILTNQNAKETDSELRILSKSDMNRAFMGALLMKKASFVENAVEKLKLFKAGHKDLELAIYRENTNTEYYFLRLIIQENAPKLVNYSKDIKKDAAYIVKNYKSLSPELQKAILSYSKTSKELKPEDFKN